MSLEINDVETKATPEHMTPRCLCHGNQKRMNLMSINSLLKRFEGRRNAHMRESRRRGPVVSVAATVSRSQIDDSPRKSEAGTVTSALGCPSADLVGNQPDRHS